MQVSGNDDAPWPTLSACCTGIVRTGCSAALICSPESSSAAPSPGVAKAPMRPGSTSSVRVAGNGALPLKSRPGYGRWRPGGRGGGLSPRHGRGTLPAVLVPRMGVIRRPARALSRCIFLGSLAERRAASDARQEGSPDRPTPGASARFTTLKPVMFGVETAFTLLTVNGGAHLLNHFVF